MQSTLQFAEDIQLDDIISDSLGYIFESFSNKVDENALSLLEIPFATQMALLKINKIVRLATVNPDGEELVDGLLEKIDPDGEPYPSTLDSWARGAVTTKKVFIEDNSYRVPGTQTSTPSVSSFRSSATGRSRNSRGTTGSRSRYGSDKGHGHGSNPLDRTGQIMELDDDPDGDFGNSLNTTGPLFNLLQKSKKAKAKGFVVTDAEKGEFDLLQDQLEEASKELRGKKFVLDRYGKPVVIGSLKAESLPPFTQHLGTAVKSLAPVQTARDGEDIDNGGDPTKHHSHAATTNGAAGTKKKKYIRVAGSRGVDEDSFRPTNSLATTLSGIEHISKVNAGVTVRSHGAVKGGEQLPEGKGQYMSRQQYFSKTQSLAQSSRRGDNSTVQSQLSRTLDGSPSHLGVGERSMFSTATESQLFGAAGSGQRAGKHSSSGRVQVGGGVGGSMSSSTAVSIDHLPDIDALEGGRRLPSAADDAPDLDQSDEELGLGPINSQGSALRGKLPRKPNAAQVTNIEMLTGSPENGKPRDRDLPKNMRPVADRKKLPAPPLGHITGHGLSLEKYMEKSAIVAANEVDDDWHQQWRNV